MFTPQYSWNSVFKLVLNTDQSIINWGDIVQHWNPTRNVLVKNKWYIEPEKLEQLLDCPLQNLSIVLSRMCCHHWTYLSIKHYGELIVKTFVYQLFLINRDLYLLVSLCKYTHFMFICHIYIINISAILAGSHQGCLSNDKRRC